MLPFTASGSIKPEEQTRMVEYYEGFLIAVDSLKRQGCFSWFIFYDTKGSANVISSILSKPEMKNMDIIFGPVHTSNIEPLANFAERNKIRLVVPFAPKVDRYSITRWYIRLIHPNLISTQKFMTIFSVNSVKPASYLSIRLMETRKKWIYQRPEKRVERQPCGPSSRFS